MLLCQFANVIKLEGLPVQNAIWSIAYNGSDKYKMIRFNAKINPTNFCYKTYPISVNFATFASRFGQIGKLVRAQL